MKANQRIAANLRHIRKKKGISQERAAEMVGMALRYYAMIESKNPRQIRVSTLEKIALGLKVPIEKLLK
jgi:transcriptional regulator with XRE-family HTH domain